MQLLRKSLILLQVNASVVMCMTVWNPGRTLQVLTQRRTLNFSKELMCEMGFGLQIVVENLKYGVFWSDLFLELLQMCSDGACALCPLTRRKKCVHKGHIYDPPSLTVGIPTQTAGQVEGRRGKRQQGTEVTGPHDCDEIMLVCHRRTSQSSFIQCNKKILFS